jgi:Phosphotyrosyl phosphate activator (PTPA) protein
MVQLLLREGEDWLYLGAVAFTRSLKKGAPFAECCPMLNDISGQPSWKKVSSHPLQNNSYRKQLQSHKLSVQLFALSSDCAVVQSTLLVKYLIADCCTRSCVSYMLLVACVEHMQ